MMKRCSTHIFALFVTMAGPICSLLQGDGPPLRITVGPEQRIFPDGLAPNMIATRNRVLIVQAFLPSPSEKLADLRWGTIFSRDGGKTWQPTARGPLSSSTAEMKDGTIVILDGIAKGPQSNGAFIGEIWESHDEWKTVKGPFEAKFYLPQGKGGVDDSGNPGADLMIHRTLMEMPNGELFATAYGWFKEDSTPSSYEERMSKFRCLLLRSKDRGRDWSLVSTIAVDPEIGEEGFGEPVLVRLTEGKHKGRFIVLMRTGSNKAKWPNPVYQTESDDGGKTWSHPHSLPFDGVNVDLIEMKNGILVAAFGWRTKESREKVLPGQPGRLGPEHGNYVAFSLDQGATWTNVTHITREPTTGYVAIREVEPQKLLLIYDIGDWGRDSKWVGYENGIEHGLVARFIDVLKQ